VGHGKHGNELGTPLRRPSSLPVSCLPCRFQSVKCAELLVSPASFLAGRPGRLPYILDASWRNVLFSLCREMPRALCSRFACAGSRATARPAPARDQRAGCPPPAANRWRRSPTPRWRGRAAAGSLRGKSLTSEDASLGDLGGDTPSRMARQGGITGYHCGKGHSAAFRSQRRESGSCP
jgi:hypothetical protein